MATPINDKLDTLVPDMYFADDCFEYQGEDSPKVACLTSLENFVYCRKRKSSTRKINFFENNRLLRLGGSPSVEAIEFNDIIKKSPTLQFDMILYRGLPETFDVVVGDVLENLGFMFCSLYKSSAMWYAKNDTSSCYTPTGINIGLAKHSKKWTLFRITVRKGTPFFDHSSIDYGCGGMLDSEIILSYEQKLRVTDLCGNEIFCETLQ